MTEKNDLQTTVPDTPVSQGESEGLSSMDQAYQDRFRQLAEDLLAKGNRYKQVKEQADRVLAELKQEQTDSEEALLNYIQATGCESVTFDGLGHFSKAESYYGHVKVSNIEQVREFFAQQKRDDEFFEVKPVAKEINRYVREKMTEFETNSARLEEGGEHIKPDIPDGIDVFTKRKISIRSRNARFGLEE